MFKPSKVIHITNVGNGISENDLLQMFQQFGVITKLVMLRPRDQALLQFQDIPSAEKALQFYTTEQPRIKGRNIYIEVSSHQELSPLFRTEPNRILFVTIYQNIYPATVAVLLQVFSPYGFVEKIVTFPRSTVFRAIIQYQGHQSAIAARNYLQGRYIYIGSCRMDIQFSKLDKLDVKYNNIWSWDFTNPFLPPGENSQSPQPGHGDAGIYILPAGIPQMSNAPAIRAAFESGLPGTSGTNDNCTVYVNNLNPERVDENKIFNLFSVYGDIVRIKYIRNKPGVALVQMCDGFQAELAVRFLKGAMLFGNRLGVGFSHHPILVSTPDTHEYGGSMLNNNLEKKYQYCMSPTKMIHICRLPEDVTEEEIINHLKEHSGIVGSKVFEMNENKQAFVLFENTEQATEALVCKHRTYLGGCLIRISFSKERILR